MTKSPLPLFGEALTKSEALRRAIGEAALRAATDVHLTLANGQKTRRVA